MKSSTMIAGAVVAVAALAGVMYSISMPKQSKQQSVHPNDVITQWICVAQNETHDFSVRVGDLAKAEEFKCPECGSIEVFRALPCPKCERFYPIGRYNASPSNCLYCGEVLPGSSINIFHGQEGH